MLGLLPDILLYSFEDPNTCPASSLGDEKGEEVDGPLAIEGIVEAGTTAGSESHEPGRTRGLID